MGSSAPSVVESPRMAVSQPAPATALKIAEEPSAPSEPVDQQSADKKLASENDTVRNAVLDALGSGGHRMLISMLEAGEWRVEGNDLTIKVAASSTVIDMSLGADARKLVVATASGILGRPVKLKVLPGAVATSAASAPRVPAPSNGSGRSRAEQDPIVRRMKEKFGAEIRTIIDYREKR